MIPAALDTPLRVLGAPSSAGAAGRLTLVNGHARLTWPGQEEASAPWEGDEVGTSRPPAGTATTPSVPVGGTDAAPDLGGELYIGPGWVDLHTHVYDAMTQISVAPDRAGLDAGVHVVADAGSAGQATIDGLVRYVIPAAGTQVRAWLNIGSHGLVHLRETADPAFIDVDATLAAIDRHREVVCGVKVRSSGAIVGAMGLQPLQLGRLVAREAGLPLLVHVGEAPPLIGDVLDLLDAGDVVTHCYHGKTGAPWLAEGAPAPALARALDRGVLLDVGHGAASFGFDVAARALAAGFPPHTISTDLHVRNIAGPVHDLATTLTKLLHCGMELERAVEAVTVTPRRILRMDQPWLGDDGAIRHATIFRLAAAAPPDRAYVDARGDTARPDRHVIPVATVREGVITEL
ncbi:amidohydrolase/deacetylase family metallohydrolase [Nonomuraea longispora]|uniref:Amidohydrolase/deacetylase family metallohydrolase n=1 Tax=Nonomuraea longispora TaxID=1848320 RepID=A0A4R4NTA7_9ACTN|nr:amidohydrolase/deacetylase family metallohydrolase [Nonomuraea longispora]TDC11260.1 amidohydrolase/deacetylase family metallohydrolase [Nonomuraea longispora]